MTTLFEKIKATKKTDYQSAYRLALANSIASKTHDNTVTIYSVTGEFLTFRLDNLK